MNHLNFALILVILSALTGGIFLLDKLFGLRKKPAFAKWKGILSFSASYFPVFFSVLLLRSFIIEPFRIPSGSLEPTLLVGDFLAVNKFSYGLRLPVSDKKIFNFSEPKRGEIAVFRWPPDPSFDYVKRVIGVPGDKIAYQNKVLTINGQKMPQEFLEYTIDESSGKTVAKYQETLNGIKHDIYLRPDMPAEDFEIEVPLHAYFMMGDNRDDSADSRFWGFVDDQYLRGKAFLIWMSWNGKTDSVRWNRIGHVIN